MNISRVDNQPNFGIRYINKKMWNRKFAKSFEQLDLTKQIDEKYPKASASYRKIAETDIDIPKPNFHLDFRISLNKNKTWNVSFDDKSSAKTDKALLEKLNNITLSDIEKEYVTKYKMKKIFSSEARVSKQNVIVSKFRKILFTVKNFLNI